MSDIPQVEWLGMTARYGKRVVEVEENSGIVSFLPMNVEISQVGTGFGVEENLSEAPVLWPPHAKS